MTSLWKAPWKWWTSRVHHLHGPSFCSATGLTQIPACPLENVRQSKTHTPLVCFCEVQSFPLLYSLLSPSEDMKEIWCEVYPSITLTLRTLCESAVLCQIILIWMLILDIQRWVHNIIWLKRKVILCFWKPYMLCGFFFLSSVAETPVIPSRFDVMADYNYSKVLLSSFSIPAMPNVMFVCLFFCYLDFSNPSVHYLLLLTPLFFVGNSGSGTPVSEDHTVAAHTPRAASPRILQLHVRHTRLCAKISIICFTALNNVWL